MLPYAQRKTDGFKQNPDEREYRECSVYVNTSGLKQCEL